MTKKQCCSIILRGYKCHKVTLIGENMNLMKKIYSQIKTDVLPIEVINSVLENKTEYARKGILKRACQKGELIRIKNGLYLIGEEDRRYGFSMYTLANFMLRPSYVSLESALSHYGLIPEGVYTTTSVTTKKSLEYQSPVGMFSFTHLKQDFFNFGFYHVKNDHSSFLIATPLKAIMDYIVVMNKKYEAVENLEEDLRFDWEEFVGFKEFVNRTSIDQMLEIYKGLRFQKILKAIRKRL